MELIFPAQCSQNTELRSNWAVLVKYNSRFCYCIAYFSSKCFQKHTSALLRAFEIQPPCWKQLSKHEAPPDSQCLYPMNMVSMVTEGLCCSCQLILYPNYRFKKYQIHQEEMLLDNKTSKIRKKHLHMTDCSVGPVHLGVSSPDLVCIHR